VALKQVVTVHRFDASDDPATTATAIDALERPRDDLVGEERDPEGGYRATSGPFGHYHRDLDDRVEADGARVVTETIEFELSIGAWRVLFNPLVKRALRARRPPGHSPWWAPPDRFGPREGAVLGMLCGLVMISGYLGTLITQTITFAADEFGSSDRTQGLTLASVRVGVVFSLATMALADRRGRRRLLIAAAILGCLATVVGAFAPNMIWLGASQTVARGFATALALLVAVVAAEEMPAGSRAYAISVLAMTAALGAGMAVWFLPLADLGIGAWRVLYVIPLVGVALAWHVGRRLPESHRYEVAHERAPTRAHPRRVALLAASAFLLAIFTAPASQFQNEFLRTEHGFSALQITIFTLATSTPGGIGVLLGGKLADLRGRRLVGSVAVAGGVGLTVVMYLAASWGIWVASAVGSVIGAAAVPALGVYGPELFPTTSRGRTNGVISAVGVVGSSAGLLIAGSLSDRWGSFGPAITLLAIGPAILAVLIIVAYPETAHLELEEINPEDRVDAGPVGPVGPITPTAPAA
jgi:MFS family permease